MPIAGLGAAPCGVSLVGVGSLNSAEAPQPNTLIDSVTGIPQGARKIVNGRYVYDDKGRIEGMDSVDQLVLLRIATIRNSSIVQGLGLPVIPDRIRQGAEAELTAIVDSAMQDLYDQKLIESLGILVEQVRPSGVRMYFRWRELPGGRERRTLLK